MTYLRQLDDVRINDVALVGGKGANLGELTCAGMPVPPGFVLTTRAYDAFVATTGIKNSIVELASVPSTEDQGAFDAAAEKIAALFAAGGIPARLVNELTAAHQQLGEQVPVAVRSSATAEDLEGASFAGQQETYLNVRGADGLLRAVKDCWASLWTARALAYRARRGIAPDTVSLAVVIQMMVDADAAGVMFTVNPATGRRDETVISAAWGLGESVVGGTVSTDDYVVEKATGRLRSRQIAEKAVMTRYAEHGTEEQPVPMARRREQVLDDAAVARLAGLGARIEQHYGAAQDIEWARAGGEFFIVQSRPVTALPEPVGAVPTTWEVPDPKALYFRASIVEQLPDPLSPLFGDLIPGAVERSLVSLMTEVFGVGVLRSGDIGFPTVNGYAYYSYTRAGLLRWLRYAPYFYRVLTELGIRRWREYSRPRYRGIVARWEAEPVAELPARTLLEGVGELLDTTAVYYTSVQSIIPIAASTELMLTRFYHRLVRRDGDPPAQTFLLGFDSAPIRAEKALYDLAAWVRGHPELIRSLDRLGTDGPPEGVDPALWREWQQRFQAHLDEHGRTIYNLDFVNPVPADDPGPLLDTLRFYLQGGGQNPHERQRGAAQRRQDATRAVRARLDPARRRVFGLLLRWAQNAAPVREDALADVGLASAPMRRMLLELGRRLVATGAITEPADVFWLRRDEIDRACAALDGARPPVAATDAVAARKTVWRGQQRATPPQLLPEHTWLDKLEALMPAASTQQEGNTITGVGASSGTVSGPARVLGGPQDFAQLRPGDVLVASITTPAWTPLFAMAAAVVTDIGGPLSHSSIVAREYGIPAVLGTGVATRRITSGEMVRVDGDTGTVTRLNPGGTAPAESASAPPAAQPAPVRSRAPRLTLLAGAALVATMGWRRWRKTASPTRPAARKVSYP